MSAEIKERLTLVFREVFRNPGIELFDEMTASDVEGWDSLTHLTLISSAEEAFGIKFKLKELVAMKNVGDFLRIIETRTGA